MLHARLGAIVDNGETQDLQQAFWIMGIILGLVLGGVVEGDGSAAAAAKGRPTATVVPTKLAVPSMVRREIGFMCSSCVMAASMRSEWADINSSSACRFG